MPKLNITPIKNNDDATPELFNSRFQKISDLVNNGLDSANFADSAITTTKLADGAVTSAKLGEEATWEAVTYKNSWVTYDTAWGPIEYYKDLTGVVHFRGMMKSGTIGSAAFTLPAGYRPSTQLLFASISNTAIARLDVKANGDVTPVAGSNAWFSLANISFRAEQ